LTSDLGTHTPTAHGVLGGAADDLEEVEEAGDTGIVEEADEAVLRILTETVESLIELAGKEVVQRFVCGPSREPGCKERTAGGMNANKLGPVVRAQRAEQQAWGADESYHGL
jgi:hypothetical protein